ncbi:MAG: GumC family protein [Acidobacteriota bacterium]
MSRHKILIVVVTLLTAVTTTIGGFYYRPSFRASTTILIKPEPRDPIGSSAARVLPTRGVSLAETAILAQSFIEIIRSRTLAEGVVRRLGLKSPGPDGPIRQALRRIKNFLLHGKTDLPAKVPIERTVASVQAAIRPKFIPKTFLMRIEVRHENPRLAADIANTATEIFIVVSKEVNAREERALVAFLQRQLKTRERELDETEAKLRRFLEAGGPILPDEQAKLLLRQYVQTDADVQQTGARIQELMEQLAATKKALARQPRMTPVGQITGANPLAQDLEAQLAKAEVELAAAEVDYGPRHPQVISIKNRIQQLRTRLREQARKVITSEETRLNKIHDNLLGRALNVQIDLEGLLARRKELQRILDRFSEKFQAISEGWTEWTRLNNDVNVARNGNNEALKNLQAARTAEARKLSEIRIIDKAMMPKTAVGFPKLLFPLLGLGLGAVLGVALGAVRDMGSTLLGARRQSL